MLISMPFNKYKRYIKRIEEKICDEVATITYDQYVAFQYFLEDFDVVKQHVEALRYIEKKDFKNLIEKFHDLHVKEGVLKPN